MKLKAPGSPRVCLAILWFSHPNILTPQLLKPCSSSSAREGGKTQQSVSSIVCVTPIYAKSKVFDALGIPDTSSSKRTRSFVPSSTHCLK